MGRWYTRQLASGNADAVKLVLAAASIIPSLGGNSKFAAPRGFAIRPPLSIGSNQFGNKWGRHAGDYGFDLKSAAGRAWYRARIREVHLNPDEVRRGPFNPDGGGGDYFFFRQGDDLLITRPGGEFVTMFPGGRSNEWFKNAEVFPH